MIPSDLSRESVRRLLRQRRISFQHTKTWKESPDPDFDAKKDRILDLYDHPPDNGGCSASTSSDPSTSSPAAG